MRARRDVDMPGRLATLASERRSDADGVRTVSSQSMSATQDLQARADALPWFHSIDLGNGVRTHGIAMETVTEDQLPDLEGRTVLDIGAWDGLYSFLAERKGATRVVSLDHYAWGVDIPARDNYWAECRTAGTLPDHSKDLGEFWRPDLPGQASFNFARKALDSNVEPVVGDFMTIDLDSLGTFDIVLYLGVLYHIKDPLTALERVRRVTKELAVIETEALRLDGLETMSLVEFFAGSEVNNDFGNWYVPTLPALHALCRAAGFSEVRTIAGPIGPPSRGASHYRALVYALV
jgi:tRNA (mo5U34)-methyltransferase